MMGRSHTISGIAVASVIIASTPLAGHPTAALATGICVAGGALFPDLDHPGATISRSLPPLTTALSRLTSLVSGGHRKGTHGIFGWMVFALTAYGLALIDIPVTIAGVTFRSWGQGFLLGLCLSLIVAALHINMKGVPSFLVFPLAFFAGATLDLPPLLLAGGVFIGCATHSVLGDGLTTERVPLLYPISKARFGFPILGRTGSSRETIYVGLLIAISFICFFSLGHGGIVPAVRDLLSMMGR